MSIHKNTEFLIVCLYPSNTTTIGCDLYYPCGFYPYAEVGFFSFDEFSQNTIVASLYGFSLSVTGIVYNKLVINLMWTQACKFNINSNKFSVFLPKRPLYLHFFARAGVA